MLRVNKVEEWLTRPRPGDRDLSRAELRAQGDCVIIRAGQGAGPQLEVSRVAAGGRSLWLHLVMMPPGTRGLPHLHTDRETAIYIVSGEAEIWYGAGLGKRSRARSGDFVYIPPGTGHLAVNRGDVTTIAVATRTDPTPDEAVVVIELPRHLADLVSLPVALQE